MMLRLLFVSVLVLHLFSSALPSLSAPSLESVNEVLDDVIGAAGDRVSSAVTSVDAVVQRTTDAVHIAAEDHAEGEEGESLLADVAEYGGDVAANAQQRLEEQLSTVERVVDLKNPIITDLLGEEGTHPLLNWWGEEDGEGAGSTEGDEEEGGGALEEAAAAVAAVDEAAEVLGELVLDEVEEVLENGEALLQKVEDAVTHASGLLDDLHVVDEPTTEEEEEEEPELPGRRLLPLHVLNGIVGDDNTITTDVRTVVESLSAVADVANQGERHVKNAAASAGNTVFQSITETAGNNVQRSVERLEGFAESVVEGTGRAVGDGAEKIGQGLMGGASTLAERTGELNEALTAAAKDLGDSAADVATTVNNAKATLNEAVTEAVAGVAMEVTEEKAELGFPTELEVPSLVDLKLRKPAILGTLPVILPKLTTLPVVGDLHHPVVLPIVDMMKTKVEKGTTVLNTAAEVMEEIKLLKTGPVDEENNSDEGSEEDDEGQRRILGEANKEEENKEEEEEEVEGAIDVSRQLQGSADSDELGDVETDEEGQLRNDDEASEENHGRLRSLGLKKREWKRKESKILKKMQKVPQSKLPQSPKKLFNLIPVMKAHPVSLAPKHLSLLPLAPPKKRLYDDDHHFDEHTKKLDEARFRLEEKLFKNAKKLEAFHHEPQYVPVDDY